jgi:fructuronate reductase
MVDSITPASDAALYGDIASTLGVEDRAAVQRESFTQWVIEDIGCQLGPDLASVGAAVTTDVGGYEKAKLRILNGAHSTLAYAGLLRGSSSVVDAMRDPELAAFVDAMIVRDIIPMLPPVHGLDIQDYRAAVLQRFRNPVIVHRLDQIAQDGSQKLPYRLGDTLIANRRAGRMPTHVVAAFGAWTAFLIRRSRSGQPIVDPAGNRLAILAFEGSPADIVARLTDEGLGIPREVLEHAALMAALGRAANDAHNEDWTSLFAG